MRDAIAIVIGGTGQTGALLTEKLLNDNAFQKVRVLARKPITKTHDKLESVIVNFGSLSEFKKAIGSGDIIFSCIGTTMKNVHGDRELYRSIDFDINVNAAKLGYENGFLKFMLMSAVGANPASSNFYLRLKGETEEAIAAIPFASIHIMQPSLLLGKRKENRGGEQIIKLFSKGISILLIGRWKKYRPIAAAEVADAMIAASKRTTNGVHRYKYAEMTSLLSAE